MLMISRLSITKPKRAGKPVHRNRPTGADDGRAKKGVNTMKEQLFHVGIQHIKTGERISLEVWAKNVNEATHGLGGCD